MVLSKATENTTFLLNIVIYIIINATVSSSSPSVG